MKSSRDRQYFSSLQEKPRCRRGYCQPQMFRSSGDGGPRKPSKQELAENALRSAVDASERLIEAKQDAEEKRVKAINLAMSAGENFDEANKRITDILREARRKKRRR